MGARRKRIEVETVGDVAIVNFVDRKILDEQNIQILGEQLLKLVDEAGCVKVILNFGNVEYLSSAAFGKLITLQKRVDNAQGKLVLCGVEPQIYEVFEMTQLHRFFRIVEQEQTALQELS